ncbi:hypothetical protein NX059_011372 [Plenodomus lindquistii]|nr:hypothetical protein NX059_011372 [Plenodomus lindquistii]
MYTTLSLQALAVVLSFSSSTEALVVRKSNNPAQEVYRDARRGVALHGHLDKRQNSSETVLDCSNDRWQELLDSNAEDRIETFCNEWLDISPATSVIEVTPTSTITTSADSTTSYTSTTRLITTQTVTETATTTMAPMARRAANIAAIAEDVIESVIESGSAVVTSSKSPQRLQAESGLANACSCKMVNPTATVTSSFTVPPVYTTVGVRKVYVVRTTETRIFTSTTTVTLSASLSPRTSDADTPTSQGSDASITAAPPATRRTETDVPVSSSASSGVSVVTAIPFTCPDDAGKRVDQVVGGYRLDYIVLCDTEIVTQDRIGFPITVDSETACAAQCSLVNAQTGQDTCQAASFEPFTDGRSGGSCTLSGSEPTYVDKEGSVAVVHTGTLANGNECRGLNASAPSSSVDTSALISSITAAPFSLSTPGLVTESADGGVFQTYVSANSTDAQGYVHWSWYAVSASSSYWWAVYSTSWECTATITRTIVTLPSEPVTITSVQVTTIIIGGVTTIISGTSTAIYTGGGGGIAPPTFVPASTTNANGEFTTFFSLATQTSTGGNGLIPPTGAPSSIGVAGNATVSGGTEIFFSTGDAGIIPPSPTTTGDAITIVSTGGIIFSTSGSTFASGFNGSEGVIPPPSTAGGSAGFSISGSTFAAQSTGDSGVIPPSINTVASSIASQSIQEFSNSTILSTGSLAFTISGSTATAFSTGNSGVIPPAPSANVSIIVTRTVVSGVASFATSRSTLASNSTGDSGIIPPIRTGSTVTVTETVTSGVATFATSDSTIVFLSTGGSGIIPPAPSANGSVILSVSATSGAAAFATSSSTFTSTGTGDSGIIPPNSGSVNPPVSTLGGSNNVTFSSSTAVTFSTGDSGIIPPPVTSVSGGSAVFATSSVTALTVSSGDSGVVPPLTGDVTVTVTTTIIPPSQTPPVNITSANGSNGFTIQLSTGVFISTGDSGIIPPAVTSVPFSNSTSTGSLFTNSGGDRTGGFSTFTQTIVGTGSSGVIRPSSNSSISAPPSATPTPSLNSTSTGSLFTNSGGDRTGGFSTFTLTIVGTGSSGVIRPSSNSTVSVPPSVTPTPSLNSTSTGSLFTNSEGDRTGGFSVGTVGSTGSIRPSSNSTISAPPSATPTPSLNSTSTGSLFTNSEGDRTGGFRSSSLMSSNSTRFGTGSVGSVTTPTPRSTTLVVLTATVVIPPSSMNISSSSAPPSSLTLAVGSSSGFPTPSSNSTTGFPTAASSSLPPLSINSTSSGIFTGITRVSNTTTAPTGGVTSLFPFGNSTTIQIITVTTSSNFTNIPSVTPSASLNITTSALFGNSSVPSATPTMSLNMTTSASICPTAPLVVTVTAVETSIQVQTTTLVQTVTVGASSNTNSEAAPAAPSSTSLVAAVRQRGVTASQFQIDAACADTANVVLNPNFAMDEAMAVPGWSVDDTDDAITVGSAPAPTGNGTIAQFKSAIVGRTLTIIQPLTLCPGQQYEISGLTRQAHKEAQCTVQYVVGDDNVATITPAETWLESSAFFTARAGAEGASADLRITASCKGFAGIPVADEEGWMRVDVSGVSVVQDKGARKMKGKKRGVLEAQRAEKQGYAVMVFSAATSD